jgi:hypothetical protein
VLEVLELASKYGGWCWRYWTGAQVRRLVLEVLELARKDGTWRWRYKCG